VIEGLPADVRPLFRHQVVPEWRAPMLATLTDKRFSNPRWVFEQKFDGERCLAFRSGPRLRLLSRNRQPLNDTYPELVDALAAQHRHGFVLDGEVVAFQGRRTSFERLQARLGITNPEQARASPIPVFYYVFDMLHLDGCATTTELPLIWRKCLLHDASWWTSPGCRWCAHRTYICLTDPTGGSWRASTWVCAR
jgi:bifunctional non-homologous end joining protein LigD